MNTQYIYKQLNRLWILVAFISLPVLFIGCGKDNPTLEPEPEEEEPIEDTTPTDESMFYKLHRVESFAGDTEYDGPVDGNRATIYFSLESKKGIPDLYQKSNLWDMSFIGIANSGIVANNGKNLKSPGYGSSGVGMIYITDKPFDEVIDIPADNLFKIGAGLDENGTFGDGLGWALYDWGGEQVADGNYEKQHVAYALGNPLTLNSGRTIVRTLIVKTAKGNYGKVKMISLYKDAFTPDKMFRKTQYPYFTFEYVLVPAGSTKFEIK